MDNNLKPIPPLRPFQRFVIQNFPFIEKDFQDLDSYGLWCKVIEYVNIIKDQVNDVTESQVDVINKFNALKDYVDNFFDNLDVQEEINNKLDDMAESGELQEIIETFLQANTAWCFDTVADMKLATNLLEGSYARTLGFYSVNDGGAGLYKIVSTGTANEMDLIAVGNLKAQLIYGNQLNVKQIGAYGDDTHDDSAIINHSISLTNRLIIPHGTFKISNTININKTMDFTCYGEIHNFANEGFIVTGRYCNIYIERITGDSTNNGFTLTSDTVNTTHNKITINFITNSQNGICFVANNGRGISYNEVHFKSLYCGNACILFQGDELSNAYISENNFYGGRLGNGYGIKTIYATSQAIPFESIRFYHVGFEGITCAAQMSHCIRWVFSDCRTSEVGTLTGDYWFILDEYSRDNYFDCTYLEVTKISDSVNEDRGYNTYVAHQLTISGTPVAKSMRIFKGKKIFEDKFNYYKYQTATEIPSGYNTLDYTVSAPYYFNGMYIEAGGDEDGSYSVTLNDAFNLYGVTDFYVYVKKKTAGSSLRIKNSSGTVVIKYTAFDGALENKLYHIAKMDRISNTNSNEWTITSVY